MTLKVEQTYQNLYLVTKKSRNTPGELRALFPDSEICVCDFYVEGSEDGRAVGTDPPAFEFEDLLFIDHHAPIPLMQRQITSTLVACEYVKERSALRSEYAIVINHTDTDSLLSALIMNGTLEPINLYVEASIAADHTGDENIISDIVQALDDDRDLEQSIETLLKVVNKRLRVREELQTHVERGQFRWVDGIAYIILDKRIDAGLVPPFLPNARVIVVASRMPEDAQKKWRIRVRLGKKAKGIYLNELKLPDFGGRWNAGSTTRHGGTDIEPEDYVDIILNRLRES